jgi:putative resolvase
VFGEYCDVASGLSDRRAGLRRALTACQDPTVTTLFVTHPNALPGSGSE